MNLGAEVDLEPAAVRRITAVARRTSCPAFVDLLWPLAPPAISVLDNPGEMFETGIRVVVVQRVGEELRY